MFIYKVKITYNNNFEKIIEVKETSKIKAEEKCKKIINDNLALIERYKNFNVYVSNFIRKCELLKETMRDEANRISKIVK